MSRSVLDNGVTVSTVRTGFGAATEYETAYICGGLVSDPIRTATKDGALRVHDRACDFARGYTKTDPDGARVIDSTLAVLLADVRAA